jgi:hypothetical protein
MASEIAEFVEILFYLLLTIFGGVMLATLAILLIMLIAALGAWLALQIAALKRQSGGAGSTARF